MNIMNRKQLKNAFSLVELVIVVVIIGVIAAIAVPRISRGAKGAGDSALRGSLQSLRNAIDMFAAEHNGAFPASDTNTEARLIDQLTKKTNAGGDPGTSSAHVFGPYLRRGFPPIPVGTNAGKATVVKVIGKAGALDATDLDTVADPPVGWIYNYQTGELIANTDATDEDGTPYWQY
jgi:general secretion pathway protein G